MEIKIKKNSEYNKKKFVTWIINKRKYFFFYSAVIESDKEEDERSKLINEIVN